MRGQRLLDHGGAGARKADDEDRLRDIAAHACTRQDLYTARGEEAAQALDEVFGFIGQIALAGRRTQRALAGIIGGKGFLIASHLVKQLAFFGPLHRPKATNKTANAPVRRALDLVEDRDRACKILGAAVKYGAG